MQLSAGCRNVPKSRIKSCRWQVWSSSVSKEVSSLDKRSLSVSMLNSSSAEDTELKSLLTRSTQRKASAWTSALLRHWSTCSSRLWNSISYVEQDRMDGQISTQRKKNRQWQCIIQTIIMLQMSSEKVSVGANLLSIVSKKMQYIFGVVLPGGE